MTLDWRRTLRAEIVTTELQIQAVEMYPLSRSRMTQRLQLVVLKRRLAGLKKDLAVMQVLGEGMDD